jgi:hypothetical protein
MRAVGREQLCGAEQLWGESSCGRTFTREMPWR